jgi:hypothetical protein
MNDPYSSNYQDKKDNHLSSRTALTAVVEIMNYDCFTESEKLQEIKLFYEDLANEIYSSQLHHYSYGFGIIEPEIRIVSNRIYFFSPLYLEDNVPELNSTVFKLFVEYLNMLQAVSLSHCLAVRGYAGIDKGYKTWVSSVHTSQTDKKDTLVLSDMLEIFTLDDIFPDGMEQRYLPHVVFPLVHGDNFLNTDRLLAEINAIGIYMPDEIRNYPCSEVSICADMLIETRLDGKNLFKANWVQWAEMHPDNYAVPDIMESIAALAKGDEKNYASLWKKFKSLAKPSEKTHKNRNPECK